ncbi:MAG: TonB-dependent receptor [Bacteroidales bacterium]
MRLYLIRIALVWGVLFGSTYLYADEKISLARQTGSYPEILSAIEANSAYRFSYRSDLFEEKGKVKFAANEENIESLLQRLLDPIAIRFTINQKIIVLRPREEIVMIQGSVRDANNGMELAGASVYDKESGHGTAVDANGAYNLRLRGGRTNLQISFIGYQPFSLPSLTLRNDTVIHFKLSPDTTALTEVIVRSRPLSETSQVHSSQMGKMSFSSKTLRQTPVLLGEADIIKTLQLTPGVSMGTEGTAGLYVRGGGNDENLFLIDGNPIYQINHIGGVFSAFNPDAISEMDFFKGGFPARYGGRLSSVVDLHTREGNSEKLKGSVTLGLISGNMSLEGPLFNKKTTFYLGLRRTWLDVLSAPAIAIVNKTQKKQGNKYRMRYAFHDLNGKIAHRIDERNKLFVSIYQGNDLFHTGYKEFSLITESNYSMNDMNNRMRWGNLMTTAGWEHRYNEQLSGKLLALYTRYHSQLKYYNESQTGRPGEEAYDFQKTENTSTNGIQDMGIRSSFDYRPLSQHRVRFGADLLYHIFNPEFTRFQGTNPESGSQPQILSNDRLHGFECALYAEDDWTLHPRVLINGGIRLSTFTTSGKTFFNAEPRASVRWLAGSNISVKAAYARMAQYVHQLSNSFLNLPTDSWMPVTAKLKPLLSDQVSAGIYYTLNSTWQFSAEGYYKKLNNLLDYKDGFSFVPGTVEWESKLTGGKGRGYGVEWMVRKESGRTTGWAGYTLSWADRQFDEINEGRMFRSRYDNRHKFNIVVMHKINPLVEITAAWSYASGNRTTLPLERYVEFEEIDYSNRGEIEYVTERNNYQLPAYHRLDLGLNVYRPKKRNRMGIWNISIYNAYNRMNPFMVYQSSKTVNHQSFPRFKQMSYFPIIPTVSYTYKF